jgi:hypothetical protein
MLKVVVRALTDRFLSRLSLAFAVLLTASAARAAGPAGANTSYWAGTTKVRCGPMSSDPTRCGAVQNITLTLVQDGSKVSGSYTCAYGNRNCRGMQEAGTVLGTLDGNRLTVVVTTPDRSNCRFNGNLEQDSGKGNYHCTGGSQYQERGTWRIHRSTEAHPASTPQVPSLLRP